MSDGITIIASVLIIAVVVAVAVGLFFFTREGMDERRRSNLMMRWRVGLQFAAVLVLLLFVFMFGKG